MSIVNCLFNIDDINHKITMRLNGTKETASLDDLLHAISQNEDLKEYDFSENFFIFEVFDRSLNEYVRFEDETEVEDMSRIRVKILDPNEIAQTFVQPKICEDDLPFCELIENRPPGEVLELFVEKHIPKPKLIEKVCNSTVNQATFTIDNVRAKRQLLKSVINYQGGFSNSDHEMVWDMINNHFRDQLGLRALQLVRGRNDLGFVRYTPMLVEREFKALIGQYNRLLRMCSNLTAQEATELWPFFKFFHINLKLDKIYPERGPSLEIMQKEFDKARKG